MSLFRVHFVNGLPADVRAATPEEARRVASQRNPGRFIKKVKKVRERVNWRDE